MSKQNTKTKLTPEQSFFLILLFVIGGFTIIMLNILSSDILSSDNMAQVNSNNNVSDFEDVVKDFALSNNLPNDFGLELFLYDGFVEFV